MDKQRIKKKLVELRKDFDTIYDDTIDMVSLDGVILKKALKDEITLMLQWEQITKHAAHLFELCENLVEYSYSHAIEEQFKNSKKMVTITEAKEFAKCDPDYREAKELLSNTRLLKEECKGILEVVHSRKYILNNLTNSIIAAADTYIL